MHKKVIAVNILHTSRLVLPKYQQGLYTFLRGVKLNHRVALKF